MYRAAHGVSADHPRGDQCVADEILLRPDGVSDDQGVAAADLRLCQDQQAVLVGHGLELSDTKKTSGKSNVRF